jgi:hypothetical protein
MALRLESPDALPERLRQRLQPFASVLAATKYWESARKHPDIRQIEDELEVFLRFQTIQAYHCTREPAPGFFESHGLRLSDLKSHQDEFLTTYGQLFTSSELVEMQAAWNDYFHRGEMAHVGRNGMVWACLARTLVLSDGTTRFFDYFGGEAIYWPVKDSPTLAPKLRAMGRPVVVELAVPGQDFRTSQPLAWFVLSQFHQTLNKDAHLYTAEGRTLRAVRPDEILRVTPKDQFVA